MLQPHRVLETVVTQWKKVEQRPPKDTAELHGIQETVVMEWKLMDSSVHCFAAWPHGKLETTVLQWKHMNNDSTVTQQALMKSKGDCDTMESHGSKDQL